MGGRIPAWLPGALMASMACSTLSGQVFVIGEKNATADLKTQYKPPPAIQLADRPPLNELGRRSLIRGLEAEQGFAHIALPIGTVLTLHANGDLKPGEEAYRTAVYKNGVSAKPGERVAITKLEISGHEIILDLNGGPYLPHRILSHISLNENPLANSGNRDQATGTRLTLVFDKFIPDLSADEVKALVNGVIDFNAKTGKLDYADTLPPKVRDAVKAHEALVGMDREMVTAALGQPARKVREHTEDGKPYEEWIYGQAPQTVRFVRFIGDRVAMIKVASRGQEMVVRDKDETGGAVPAITTRQIAYGDAQPGDAAKREAVKPPSILNPGETVSEPQGSMRKVEFPTEGGDDTSSSPRPNTPAQGNAPPALHPVEFPGAGTIPDASQPSQ